MNFKRIYKTIQFFLIRSNSFKIFNRLGVFYYYSGLKIFLYILKSFPEIKSVYLRNSLATGDWVPWESDIDLTLVIDGMLSDKEFMFLNKLWGIYRILNIPFPFIRHIDIFSLEEFKLDVLYSQSQISYLTKNLKLIYGKEYRKKIDCTSGGIFSFRIHDWMQFMKLFYEDDFNGKRYIRRYYRFFNDILSYFGNNDINSRGLKDMLYSAKTFGFFLQEPKQFIMRGFYYALNILDNHHEVFQSEKNSTKFHHIYLDEKFAGSFLEKADSFVNSLSTYMRNIKSVFIDEGSLINDYNRIWIILKDNIQEKDFIELAISIKRNVFLVFKRDITPFIFREGSFSLFLNTQRLWVFEYFHLARHAKVVFGENVFIGFHGPSDYYMLKMIQGSTIVCRNFLRNTLKRKYLDEYPKCLAHILNYKILLEKDIIVTTKNELVKAYDECYDQKEIDLFMRVLNSKFSIDKNQIYVLLKSTLDTLSERCLGNESNK